MSDSPYSYQNKLYIHEWLAVFLFISILLILTLVSQIWNASSDFSYESHTEVHHLNRQEITVSIDGEVEFPGSYSVKKGSTIQDLLFLAKPKESANLKPIKIEALLKKGQCVKILKQELIKIILIFPDGSVDERPVIKGTKLSDLPSLYTFEDDIDLKKLQKKRCLKAGEEIKIFQKRGFSKKI